MDCTGCQVCAQNFPTGALEMVSYENNINKQSKYWNYAINNISNKTMNENLLSSNDHNL